MLTLAYHASHEQFPPSALLKYAQLAKQAGFSAIACSDHFHPWTEEQGQSGFAWAWLGAAMQITQLPFSIVSTPSYRYHPAILAQAVATLNEMYPNRFTLAVGDGEALNESIIGERWPIKEERRERLLESANIIRSLWKGETVTHHGLIKIEHAKLYTRPNHDLLLFGAAITPETARWIGTWADGLITISQPIDKLRDVINNFKTHGGQNKPMHLKVQLSYAQNKNLARELAWKQWKNGVFSSDVLAELRTPQQLDHAATLIKPEDMDKFVTLASSPHQLLEAISEYKNLGFDTISLHNVNLEQEKFISDIGEYVISQVNISS